MLMLRIHSNEVLSIEDFIANCYSILWNNRIFREGRNTPTDASPGVDY